MRKQFLIFGVILILVSSCNNKNRKDIYVFKSTLKNDSINLFVDEKEIGQIPWNAQLFDRKNSCCFNIYHKSKLN